MISGVGRMVMLAGVVLFVIGLVLFLSERLPGIGKLPGDIHIKKENMTVYFPVMTCILLSVLLTLLFNLFSRR